MKFRNMVVLISILTIAGAALHADGGFIEVEGGVAFTGYNDVRIPSETGTMLSLATDTIPDPAFAFRVRGGYTFADRHTVMVLVAPLMVRGSGTLDEIVSYNGVTFAAGTAVESVYRFDSYRLSYRYTFVDRETLDLRAGLTVKLRSADIALMSAGGYAHRSNLGVVPLISFMGEWNFSGPFSLLLDADALVTPFGRAEDVLASLQYKPSGTVAYRRIPGARGWI